jgi:hypothetical protein
MIKPFTKQMQAGRSAMTAEEFKTTNESESHLQSQCEEYLRLMRIDFIHIPASVYKLAATGTGGERRAAHDLHGFPDLMIFKPHMAEAGQNDALFVELKNSKGKLSQGQKTLARHLNIVVIRSFDDFVKLVNEWMEEET